MKIFVSGDLDEFRIAELLGKGAKIDSFGVGTKMGTSADRPYLDVIYKLCETNDCDQRLFANYEAKHRQTDFAGQKTGLPFQRRRRQLREDVIALADERVDAEPLLVKVMDEGKLIYTLAIA